MGCCKCCCRCANERGSTTGRGPIGRFGVPLQATAEIISEFCRDGLNREDEARIMAAGLAAEIPDTDIFLLAAVGELLMERAARAFEAQAKGSRVRQ